MYWWAGPSDSRADDRDAMIGTWTDPNGPPGNSIRFYYVPTDLPDTTLVKAYEGHIDLTHFLGREKGKATWNYGGWNPLILNIGLGKTGFFAAIRKIDDDHILIRFGKDAEEIYRPGATDHADTLQLTRIGREPPL
jgi:hypothetical protein